ncbi:hypothetical protein ACPEEZ_05295 [Frigoribacterium sp. 2-23]
MTASLPSRSPGDSSSTSSESTRSGDMTALVGLSHEALVALVKTRLRIG